MHKLSRPKDNYYGTYKPWCQITGIQQRRNVQGEGVKKPGTNKPGGARHRGQIGQRANKPGGEWAKERTSQGANQPDTGGEQLSQGAKEPEANQPGGKQARGRTSQGANEPGGERARGEKARGKPAKGQKSQTPFSLVRCTETLSPSPVHDSVRTLCVLLVSLQELISFFRCWRLIQC